MMKPFEKGINISLQKGSVSSKTRSVCANARGSAIALPVHSYRGANKYIH